MTPRILAFDLSTASTGVCFPDGSTDTLKPPAKLDRAARCAWFGSAFDVIFADWCPTLVVVESPFTGSNRQTGHILSELHGVLKDRIGRAGVVWQVVPPSTLKRAATGRGDASKEQMIARARELGADVANDDEADAWLLWHGAREGWWG